MERKIKFCIILHCVCVADNFGYCGSLAGENTANAENEMAVTSAKRKKKKTKRSRLLRLLAEIGYEQSVLSKALDKSIEQMLAVVPRVSSDPNMFKKTILKNF